MVNTISSPKKILITGGAGFIGSHLADSLINQGYEVTLFDMLHPQVHGVERRLPDYLNPAAHLIQGDVRDANALAAALDGIEVVFHFAAYTGVGQSMYQISEYLDVNVQGTAALLELLSRPSSSVRKLIVASSRAVYGEGAYHCPRCGPVSPLPRTAEQLRAGRWELTCPCCGQTVQPIPTPETQTTDPRSIYAVSKLNQEQISLLIGEAYGLPVVVLRFFNVYGPRQSLKNPYTGVINTFITRSMNGLPPQVYEDGRESRDFVHVSDVCQACLLAMTNEAANGRIFNVGSGQSLSLLEVAQTIATHLGGPAPVITGQYRVGDIRHCDADLTHARQRLSYSPAVSFAAGITQLLNEVAGQVWADQSGKAEAELVARGLSARPHSI
jgi:dTDP-L-rhamnose 4-epimerase